MQGNTPPNYAELSALGKRLHTDYGQYKKDRRPVEEEWLRNLRQFKGKYDPEIIKHIGEDQSKAYPKTTRTKVVNTVARLMEMMFPQTEKNWGISPSPIPRLSVEDLQSVLDSLRAEGNPTEDDVNKAVKEFAAVKAERMEEAIDDQLDEIGYVDLARKVVASAVKYSIGLAKGPLVKRRTGVTYRASASGAWEAHEVEERAPYLEHVSVWDWYPDLSAKQFDQMDAEFQRHIMSRAQVAELARRPDFFSAPLKKWLADHTSGNYVELWWETDMRADPMSKDRAQVGNIGARKYELWERWGVVFGRDLHAAGIPVPEDKMDEAQHANVWGIDDTVIKVAMHPFDGKAQMYHKFVYEDDDVNLTGAGLPPIVRDSQMAIAEAARMTLDNASLVCGDMVEMNIDLLLPGQSPNLHARKTWLRTGSGPEATVPAVRAVQMNSHIPELLSVIETFRGFADEETTLPPPAMGDPTRGGSEALRTTGGVSMLLGAAALPIRDVVRNFDKFTTSVISAMYHWNMEFSPRPSIKGDYSVIARGATSLIAKEVLATSLDQFAATLSDDDRLNVDTRKLLEHRMKARDLPKDVLRSKEEAQNAMAQRAEEAAAQAALQGQAATADIRATIAQAFRDVATGVKAQADANTGTFEAIVEGTRDDGIGDTAGRGSASVRSASSAGRTGGAGAAAAKQD